MFGNDNDINLTIKAKDEASKEVKSFEQSIAELTKSINDAEKATQTFTKTQQKSADVHKSMASEVFKGVAAWDLLKKATSEATDFMVSSVKAYLDAQKQIDLTRAVVVSMGKSFDDVGPILKKFGDTMAGMGIDDEDAALAAAKLAKVAGGDLTRGMQLAKLAADLTASGYNDLAGNVDNLTRVLSGKGQRALMDYRINLSDNATTAEQLAAIQAKVTQTTEQFAQTIPGQIDSVKVAYQNLKEEVGGSFVAALNSSITSGQGAASTLDAMKVASQGLSIAVFELVNGLIAIVEAAQLVGTGINAAIVSVKALGDAMKGDIGKAGPEAGAAIDSMKGAVGSLKDTLARIMNPVSSLADAQKALGSQSKKTASDLGGSFAGITNANKNLGTSTDKLISKYKDLTDALIKVRQTGVDELASLAKAHDTAVTSSKDRITELKKSLSDLSDQYSRTASDAARAFAQQQQQDAAGIGDAIVAQQKKIADLKQQAGYETDPQKKILLEAQLKQEQDAYDGQAEFIKSMSAQVIEAKRRDSLTDFERQIEDYKAKRVQADQEYADARADADREYSARQTEIKKSIDQEKNKLALENENYITAQALITKTLADAEKLRVDTSKKSADDVIKLVDAQIDRYNRLADAIQRASQGKPAQITQAASVPIREHGGIVPGPVGMPVPIIAHGQERVLSATNSSGAGSTSGPVMITINNPTVRSDADLNAFRQLIENALRDVSRVHKLTTI